MEYKKDDKVTILIEQSEREKIGIINAVKNPCIIISKYNSRRDGYFVKTANHKTLGIPSKYIFKTIE